ncbi:class I SAM-dependent methyltransferase [Halomicroarcula sp. GCM10025709]|uniref:class I SAM-dependent methyltransferase n=1 Tax=Haloarcula TaxID=2237 RepID=UPI0024C26C70|nr:methyltransferase [Halomicroarcula sp. YJ-61-S]
MCDDRHSTDPYCPLRVDNEARWAFLEQYVESQHRTALDIGCAEGYFTKAVAECGLEATGVEATEARYERAEATFGDDENVRFRHHRVTPETVDDLPATDLTLLLTVQHHWLRAYGVEPATRMLKHVAQRTSRLFYEPPGDMYVPAQRPIDPSRSVRLYRTYLQRLFDGQAVVRDVEMFDHVEEGEYASRRDPLFVLDTDSVGSGE